MTLDVSRINQLANKAKTVGLTEDEKLEQQTLRQQYISAWREGVIQTLDNTYIMDENGNKTALKKK